MIDMFLAQQCLVAPKLGSSMHGGQAQWGSEVPQACRFEQRSSVVGVPGGDVVVGEAQLWLPGGSRIGVGDRVTYQGARFEVVFVARGQALDFENHVVATLATARK